MLIREANIKDVNDIARVHVDTWKTSYSKFIKEDYLKNRTYEWQAQKWLDRLFNNKNAKEFMYVAENDRRQVVGFASGEMNPEREKHDSILYTIYILKEYQGQGIGRKLFEVVWNRLKSGGAKDMIVWAFKENTACKFYENLGGSLVDKKEAVKGGVELDEVAYLFK
ncbi:GNAT family N-acetyltransferase [Clostridium felsineum]|uniref:Uncharacterized protein n=1 Tax=Clostridium felsineum TaxID=36839 RepID=A0A1S8L6X3_9CLOT|nr:GNAT family N-acetyltransferase [Clostridium felsineum]URZ04723.1 hypothetical protein CLROS_000320 [Clostridium felsineum]URZ09696.1 hypothetical protein CROST_003890 [Clostridium felsineum]